jgi:hypothetical protein
MNRYLIAAAVLGAYALTVTVLAGATTGAVLGVAIIAALIVSGRKYSA